MVTPTWEQVRGRRLARSGLLEPGGGVAEIAGGVLGLHAQVQVSAELQLAARVTGLVRADVRAAVWERLDGRCLLRDELVAEVVERVGPASRTRLASGFAFFLGDLCHGPPQGTKITLTRPDQWAPSWHEADESEALRDVAQRFLRTYGPARPVDFAEWFGPKPADARSLFESLELEEVDVEGH